MESCRVLLFFLVIYFNHVWVFMENIVSKTTDLYKCQNDTAHFYWNYETAGLGGLIWARKDLSEIMVYYDPESKPENRPGYPKEKVSVSTSPGNGTMEIKLINDTDTGIYSFKSSYKSGKEHEQIVNFTVWEAGLTPFIYENNTCALKGAYNVTLTLQCHGGSIFSKLGNGYIIVEPTNHQMMCNRCCASGGNSVCGNNNQCVTNLLVSSTPNVPKSEVYSTPASHEAEVSLPPKVSESEDRVLPGAIAGLILLLLLCIGILIWEMRHKLIGTQQGTN